MWHTLLIVDEAPRITNMIKSYNLCPVRFCFLVCVLNPRIKLQDFGQEQTISYDLLTWISLGRGLQHTCGGTWI